MSSVNRAGNGLIGQPQQQKPHKGQTEYASKRKRRRLIVRRGRGETEEESFLLSMVCVIFLCPFREKSREGRAYGVHVAPNVQGYFKESQESSKKVML